jgi:ClpP class serine protease
VAASGGYMMACVADKIVASPFAILGSVGVVASMLNFSSRMEREGLMMEDVTAGKYKRTMTPYKKPNSEDRAKVKSDVEGILELFKDFVKKQRPQLDIDKIATGEIWYGPKAKEVGLVDELRTIDEILTTLREDGADIYKVSLVKGDGQPSLLSGMVSSEMLSNLGQWVVRTVRSAVHESLISDEFESQQPDERKMFMALDTSSHPRL